MGSLNRNKLIVDMEEKWLQNHGCCALVFNSLSSPSLSVQVSHSTFEELNLIALNGIWLIEFPDRSITFCFHIW